MTSISRASKPCKSAGKSPPKGGIKAKPGASEAKPMKLLSFDIEGEPIDEVQMATWVQQAGALPGFLRP